MRTILLWLSILLCSISAVSADSPAMVDSLEDAMALSESTKMPALVIFGADWCGYCKTLKNHISSGDLNKQLDNYIICYIDVEKNPELKREFSVKTLPDSRIFIENQEKSQYKGYDKNKYKKWIENAY